MAISTSTANANISKVRDWYYKLASKSHINGKSSTGKQAQRNTSDPIFNQVAIDWDKAINLGEYEVVPFLDMENPFEEAGKYGYRFLVARMADDLPYTGRIVELVVSDHTATLSQAAQWALAGAGPRLSGQEPQPASISGLTGWLLIYSPGYVYESGL